MYRKHIKSLATKSVKLYIISSPWIWKCVSATLQSGISTLSHPRGRDIMIAWSIPVLWRQTVPLRRSSRRSWAWRGSDLHRKWQHHRYPESKAPVWKQVRSKTVVRSVDECPPSWNISNCQNMITMRYNEAVRYNEIQWGWGKDRESPVGAVCSANLKTKISVRGPTICYRMSRRRMMFLLSWVDIMR